MLHARRAAAHLTAVRETNPLVHNITNYVSMDVAANVLLALGASPAMVHAVEEAADFAKLSHALVLNIGTLSPRWIEAMHAAAAAARDKGIPIVLDPVGAGATAFRTETSLALLEGGVTAVRANASEVLALAGASGSTRGVDSTHATAEAAAPAMQLANKFDCLVAATGEVDLVTDGAAQRLVRGGHPLMTKVTALGCAASGVVGAFLGANPSAPRLDVTASALAAYGLAGAKAAVGAEGPGSFRARFLDALHTLTPEAVAASAQVEG